VTLAAASVARVVQRDSEALPPFASMLLGVVPAMPHVAQPIGQQAQGGLGQPAVARFNVPQMGLDYEPWQRDPDAAGRERQRARQRAGRKLADLLGANESKLVQADLEFASASVDDVLAKMQLRPEVSLDATLQSPVVVRAARKLAEDFGLDPVRVARAVESGASWGEVDALFADEVVKRRRGDAPQMAAAEPSRAELLRSRDRPGQLGPLREEPLPEAFLQERVDQLVGRVEAAMAQANAPPEALQEIARLAREYAARLRSAGLPVPRGALLRELAMLLRRDEKAAAQRWQTSGASRIGRLIIKLSRALYDVGAPSDALEDLAAALTTQRAGAPSEDLPPRDALEAEAAELASRSVREAANEALRDALVLKYGAGLGEVVLDCGSGGTRVWSGSETRLRWPAQVMVGKDRPLAELCSSQAGREDFARAVQYLSRGGRRVLIGATAGLREALASGEVTETDIRDLIRLLPSTAVLRVLRGEEEAAFELYAVRSAVEWPPPGAIAGSTTGAIGMLSMGGRSMQVGTPEDDVYSLPFSAKYARRLLEDEERSESWPSRIRSCRRFFAEKCTAVQASQNLPTFKGTFVAATDVNEVGFACGLVGGPPITAAELTLVLETRLKELIQRDPAGYSSRRSFVAQLLAVEATVRCFFDHDAQLVFTDNDVSWVHGYFGGRTSSEVV